MRRTYSARVAGPGSEESAADIRGGEERGTGTGE